MKDKNAEYWEHHLSQTAEKMLCCYSETFERKAFFQAQCPEITKHIAQLKTQEQALSLWGKSRNFDEFAKLEIVSPEILEIIGQLSGVSMKGESLHAGLLHTYGYLFSLIETPFGFKRDRWIKARFGERFHLPTDTFSPAPQEGSLLLNLTYFLGSLVLRDHPVAKKILHKLRPLLSEELSNYHFEHLQRWRITETIPVLGPNRRPQRLRLHTDLVLPPESSVFPEQLLIYSVEYEQKQPTLFTAFFVSSDSVETLLKQNQHNREDIPLRYNAFVEELAPFPQQGTRSISLRSWTLSRS